MKKDNPALAVLAVPVCMAVAALVGAVVGSFYGTMMTGIYAGIFLGGIFGVFAFGYLYFTMRKKAELAGQPLKASATYAPVFAGVILLLLAAILVFIPLPF